MPKNTDGDPWIIIPSEVSQIEKNKYDVIYM